MATNQENLNKRKAELLDQQTLVLNQSMEAKRKLSDAEEATFQASTKEIADIDQTLARFAAIAKSKTEASLQRQSVRPPVRFARGFCVGAGGRTSTGGGRLTRRGRVARPATFRALETSKSFGAKQRSEITDRPFRSPLKRSHGPMSSLLRSPSF
jgi:hypothetical protein